MGAPGFDDAPLTAVERSTIPKPITLIVPYYENPLFLARQLAGWADFPEEIRSCFRVIVVDDGSPANPAVVVVKKNARFAAQVASFKLFRIEVDVRWNWLAARNIGMHHAEQGWNVLTDIDHVLTADVARSLIWHAHKPTTIYRFRRREWTGEKIHPHPNSMFMTRATFWHVGGYDEALSGCYGTDGDWRRRCAAAAKVATLEDELVRYEYVDDSSTTRYLRKQPEDARKKKIIATRRKGWRPKVLSFPYHEVPV